MSAHGPLVSVVMPVHNAERFVREAIESILGQTYTNLELVVIDDGSTDASAAVINSFSDRRIRCLNQENQGIAAALNTGIGLSRGEFIARMDADDISMPERLEKQVAFMGANPGVGMLGTWATVMNENGVPTGSFEHPTDDARIRYALLFDTPFVHPSMMVRRDLFTRVGSYDGDPAIFEDYDLWSRMSLRTKAANLPVHLLRYRLVGTGLTRATARYTERVFEQRVRNARAFLPGIDEDLARAVAEHGLRHAQITKKQFGQVHALLDRFISETLGGSASAREARRRMNHGMLGYRLIAHRTFVHRVTDRILKEAMLILMRALPSSRHASVT